MHKLHCLEMKTPDPISARATEEVRDYYDLNTARVREPRDSDADPPRRVGLKRHGQAEAFQHAWIVWSFANCRRLASAFPAPLHVLDLRLASATA
jgi:hypothetical protein